MSRHAAHRGHRHILRLRDRQRAMLHRPMFESLEDRTMLDTGGLPAAIVVGRTLATSSTAATSTPAPSYFVGEVEDNQVTETITVYNEAADTETGILVTDTLSPGVTLVSSTVTLDGTTTTQRPDQSGQNLAISLAPIQGYDRESVALTLDLPALSASMTGPFAIDSGANAYAMIDAGAVSASTPAATLRPGNVSDPSLLASTVDADTNDPFIQEEAAALDYSAQNIFNFLHTQIVYNSYLGSVRGARGTLWSLAGNALDTASLGVALMRASGIPAQYVSGTLSQSQAQTLILSMFPAQYQTVGYIPAGTQVSDPANDPQLLSETESHCWFQFDTGSSMQDADPLMPGATLGKAFTTSTGAFTAVPADLEATTNVQVVAEIYSTADATFGLNALQDTTVLNQTFDDDYLVGRPLTIGNFVSTTSAGFIFSATTTTYTPYIETEDVALPASEQPEAITGTPHQEVLTNFPLASEVLTGLFLNISLNAPGAPEQTYDRTLVDLIGPAARQGLANPNVAVDPNGPPVVSSLDTWTVDVDSSLYDSDALQSQLEQLAQLQDTFVNYSTELQNMSVLTTQSPLALAAPDMLRNALIEMELSRLAQFAVLSNTLTESMASGLGVKAYFDSPNITILSSQVSVTTDGSLELNLSLDLRKDTVRAIAFPGNSAAAVVGFTYDRSMTESEIEGEILASPPEASSTVIVTSVSTPVVLSDAQQQGIPLVTLAPGDIGALELLNISADSRALIADALNAGNWVIVPTSKVSVGGEPRLAWYEIDAATGQATGVSEDGENQGLAEFIGNQIFNPTSQTNIFAEGVIAGLSARSFFNVIVFFAKVAFNSAVNAVNAPGYSALGDLKNYLYTIYQAVTNQFERARFCSRHSSRRVSAWASPGLWHSLLIPQWVVRF
jgi:large repetitive protein